MLRNFIFKELMQLLGVLTAAFFGRFWLVFHFVFGSFLLPEDKSWQ